MRLKPLNRQAPVRAVVAVLRPGAARRAPPQSRGASSSKRPIAARARSAFRPVANLLAVLVTACVAASSRASSTSDSPWAPTALAATGDGKTLFIACATAAQVVFFDTGSRQVRKLVPVPEAPLGLALSADDSTLYVTCAAPQSCLRIIDAVRGKTIGNIPAGHTAMAPVLGPDGRTLYVCNRFNNDVGFIDLATRREIKRVNVPREPVAAAITPDGKFLLVANHLHAGRADDDFVASSVSVIDTAAGQVIREIILPNGSGLLRDIRISPDGKYACVTHLISRFHLPTTQVERGWINSNALSLVDLAALKLINTVLLDNIDRGAANPWAAAWSADGARICVTHAGTHELSVIDFPALLAKLSRLPAAPDPNAKTNYAASRTAADVPNDLSFLVGLRRRIKLSERDRGPRALTLIGTRAYLANYFTDTLAVIDLRAEQPVAESVPLGPARPMDEVRRGEFLFNDATICFQGWQSCSSCHSSDARVDGLNWDNLNDGIGNPKNAKSLLLAHQTPPSMWLGVRSDARAAVRAGIRNSLFTVRPEEDAVAIDAYLESLRPIPSPYLAHGRRSPAAERGRKLFFDETVGCADCHKGSRYTDQKFHDVGTVGKFDQLTDRFDTPTLIEVWRSGPYLHDGRAASVREVIAQFNPQDQHGHTSKLSAEQLNDLAAFVLSL